MGILRRTKELIYSLSHRDQVTANSELKAKFAQLEAERRAATPANLMNFESTASSQNGEDGILDEIFSRLPPRTDIGCFVECGAGSGRQNNTRHLLEQGWRGVWIEGSRRRARKASSAFSRPALTVVNSLITATNIETILRDSGVPREFDLLSIDIDGNDYWIWEALKLWQPHVVIAEYNAFFLPDEFWVMPYDERHVWPGTNYFGASLASFSQFAESIGYRLVACDSMGVNAFFVRKEFVGSQFPFPGDIGYHYVSPKYNKIHFGQPPDRRLQSFLQARTFAAAPGD